MMKGRLIFLFFLVWGLTHFAQQKTDRFTLSKISKVLLDHEISDFDPALLDRPYTYLGKGGQSYVFVSEDGDYVLKAFRSSRLQILELLSLLPHFEKKKHHLEQQIKETLKSYALAFEKLSEETGLVAIHLDNHKQIHTPLKIIDKLGICHTMDPNLISFVIQKKAVLVKDKIAADADAAKEHLASLFSLLKTRIEKGIEDADPNFAKNFGFVGNRAVQIDGGRFFLCESPSKAYIEKAKVDLQHWINANYPALSEDFHTLYEAFCDETF